MDKDAFDKAVSMFQDMHIYTKAFEPRLLHLSQQYMLSWADRESSTQTLGGYVKAVRTLMEKEMSRVDLFRLPGSTRRDLLMLMEDLLITRKQARLSMSRPFATATAHANSP